LAPTRSGTLAAVGNSSGRRPVTRLGCLLDTSAVPDDGNGTFDHLSGLARAAESAGFDSLWVIDDVAGAGGNGEGRPHLEAYSLLGALAMCTRAVHLGALPTGHDNRAPAIVAKTVTSLDVLSHGRGLLTVGVDAGHDSDIERLRERLQISRSVLRDDTPTFSGTYYSIAGAVNRPGPVQVGGVPILVFVGPDASSRSGALAAAATVADAVVVTGSPDDVQDAVDEVTYATRGRKGPSNPTQVIWLGSPTAGGVSRPPVITDLVAECRARFAAGADGCIAVMNGPTVTEQLRQMDRLGRELAL
jgi:alkanesulfonate monooxygenase SsuD/methylene tetrahydromethanopterin reductase-like flavin-dependent oxidoreductase (luciferase family)